MSCNFPLTMCNSNAFHMPHLIDRVLAPGRTDHSLKHHNQFNASPPTLRNRNRLLDSFYICLYSHVLTRSTLYRLWDTMKVANKNIQMY